jgi:GNAT superfamily N-acetyltransferase
MKLQIKIIKPEDNKNKKRVKEFMKEIPMVELEGIGVPVNENCSLDLFEKEFTEGNLIPYMATEKSEIWGMLLAWKSKTLFIDINQPLIEKNLNLKKWDGWELLGAYTREDKRGLGINKIILEKLIQDTKQMNISLYVIIRANIELEKKMQEIYKKHIQNFDKIIKEKEYNFDAYVDLLSNKNIPGKEIIKLINEMKNYDERALAAQKLWSKRVKENKAILPGHYFMDGAPFYISQ